MVVRLLLLVALAIGALACPYLDGTMGDENALHGAQPGGRNLRFFLDDEEEEEVGHLLYQDRDRRDRPYEDMNFHMGANQGYDSYHSAEWDSDRPQQHDRYQDETSSRLVNDRVSRDRYMPYWDSRGRDRSRWESRYAYDNARWESKPVHEGTGPEYNTETGPEYGGSEKPEYGSKTGPEYGGAEGPEYGSKTGAQYNGGEPEYGSKTGPEYNGGKPEYTGSEPEYGNKNGPEYGGEYGSGSTSYGGKSTVDWKALKADIGTMLRTSQDFWPADYGYYGGLMVRLAWHCSGSYRKFDGRGGCDGGRIRFAPEADWEDNGNLDKARKLLEPIKNKYGDALSWGDLIAYAGDQAIVQAGGPSLGFCSGRIDDTNGAKSLPLGPNKEQEAIAPCPVNGECESRLGPTTLQLIYVNPEGPMKNPVPKLSAPQIRSTFARMGMNDSETVALIGAGHALGKTHGACPLGNGQCGEGPLKGIGPNTFTSGFEGPWTTTPTEWSNGYFVNLLKYKWEKIKGPGGHYQWAPKHKDGKSGKLPNIMMLTADLALLEDPSYLKYVEKFAADKAAMDHAFKHAWYKLVTNDMGPITRCLGPEVPPPQPFQCPLPAPSKEQPDYKKVGEEIKQLLTSSSNEGDKVGEGYHYGGHFIHLAWQSASTYRDTDHQGGTDGARIRFSPIKDFPSNGGLDKVLQVLEPIKQKYPGMSYADLIVLAGNVALEAAGAGEIPFCGQRSDATEACENDQHLAPRDYPSALVAVLDNPRVMGLTKQEYIALAGRPRSASMYKKMGYKGSWCEDPSKLTNKYFKTLLEEEWELVQGGYGKGEYKAKGKELYLTAEDYVLKSNSKLRLIVEEYAADEGKFIAEFVKAWTKLMNAGRYKGPGEPYCPSD